MHICKFYTGQVLETLLTAGGAVTWKALKMREGWLCESSQTAGRPDSRTNFPKHRLSEEVVNLNARLGEDKPHMHTCLRLLDE